MRKLSIIAIAALNIAAAYAQRSQNFNAEWKIGDKSVTLPRAWNEEYAFKVPIEKLPDAEVTYTKTFLAPKTWKGKKVLHWERECPRGENRQQPSEQHPQSGFISMEQQELQRQLRWTAQEREVARDRPPLSDTPTLFRSRNNGYVYAKNHDVKGGKAIIHAESEVRNETGKKQTFILSH